MKFLAASTDPDFLEELKSLSSDFNIELVETGADVLDLLANSKYSGLITDASIHDVKIWQLVRLIRSGKWCDVTFPIVIVDERNVELSSLLAINYNVKLIPLDETHTLLQELRAPPVKPKILVIEDDIDAAKGAYHALKNDYEVELSGSGEEGLESFKVNRHDLILLDLTLPDMFGGKILNAIHGINPKQAVIISTARTEPSMYKMLMFAGASEYLAKPYGLEELRKACRIVYTQAMLSQEIAIREKTIDGMAAKISLINQYMEEKNHEEAHEEIISLLLVMPERFPGDDSFL